MSRMSDVDIEKRQQRNMIQELLDYEPLDSKVHGMLSEWEISFLESLAAMMDGDPSWGLLSDKQRAKVEEIRAKIF